MIMKEAIRGNGSQRLQDTEYAGSQLVVPVSEIDRETQGVDTQLTYLEGRLQILQRRLQPVIAHVDTDLVGKSPGAPGPSSELGGQLRGYANRAESIAATIDYLLEHLALA